MTGEKYDDGKPRYDLLPAGALAQLVDVLTFGASKYEPNGWRHVKDASSRYLAAAERHIWAWVRGDDIDLESGLPHLAHAACCLMFLAELDDPGYRHRPCSNSSSQPVSSSPLPGITQELRKQCVQSLREKLPYRFGKETPTSARPLRSSSRSRSGKARSKKRS